MPIKDIENQIKNNGKTLPTKPKTLDNKTLFLPPLKKN